MRENNGKLIGKIFKRYSQVEEFHKNIWSFFTGKYLPGIPPKTIIKNETTEVTERRQINFELFFQTIMIHDDYINHDLAREFFKFDYNSDEEDKPDELTIYYIDKDISNMKVKVNFTTRTKDIIEELNRSWFIPDIRNYRIWFFTEKYGERILDEYESPCQAIDTYIVSSGSFFSKLSGKRITKKPRNNIIKYFNEKSYMFYLRRVFFYPRDFTLEFRFKDDDEIKRRYYQALFDLRVENIILESPEEYVDFWGLMTFILCKNQKEWKSHKVVDFAKIISIIPKSIYKKAHKKEEWERKILDKWEAYSTKLSDPREGAITFLANVAKKNYYGANLFWVEKYTHNKHKWLQRYMWLIVRHDVLILANEKLTEEIKRFDYTEWTCNHFPNAIILSNGIEEPIRLTISVVYPAYYIINEYQRRFFWGEEEETKEEEEESKFDEEFKQ